VIRIAKLGDVADLNPRKPASVKARKDHVAFLGMADVGEDGRFAIAETRAVPSVLTGYTYFERGDVLVAKITPCMENGKATHLRGLPTDIGFGSTEFHVVRPGPYADARYLFYLLWNPVFRHIAARNMTGTAGQRRVPTHFLERVPVPLPPLDEQRRIAAILDVADAIRRKRREAITLVKDLLGSTFVEMFGDPVRNPKGWPSVPLKSVAAINSGITKNARLATSDAEEVPYMRVANVQDGYLDLDEIKMIPVAKAKVAKYLLKKGDVLLTEGGDPDKLGRGTVWQGQIERCVHQNHIFSVRVDQTRLSPQFVSAQVGSHRGKRYFLRAAKQTTGIASINKTQLSEFPLLVPPLALQADFESAVLSVRELEGDLQRAATTDDNLFNALVQRAFRGEL
jgi:type I restriction enzyme, S subunit